MAANYNRPKPADPLWYRARHVLSITCGHPRGDNDESPCTHGASMSCEAWALKTRTDQKRTISHLISRLRCSRCGKKPPLHARIDPDR